MSSNIINNPKRNYEFLINKNECINNNNLIIKDINEIVNDSNIKSKMNNLLNIYNRMNLNINYIIGEININQNDINKDIRIINSYEECKRIHKWKDSEYAERYENEKEIKEKCKIKINNQNIPFCYNYKFNKAGKYIIEYTFNDLISKTDYMFRDCESLVNLDLSNFNSQNVTTIKVFLVHP